MTVETTGHPISADGSPGAAPRRSRAAHPLAWLYVGLSGLLLVCAGVAIGLSRSWDDALAVGLVGVGLALAAVGALMALTLTAFAGELSPSSVLQRGVGVLAVWMAVAGLAAGAVTYAATVGLPFGDSSQPATPHVTSPAASNSLAAASDVPGAGQRLTLRGNLTLDGKPLDAQFLGARVINKGLLAACQLAIPPVATGHYEIIVMSEAESRGCGAPGAQVVLWTSVGNGIIYTRETFPWSEPSGAAPTFNATFSSADPAGAGGVATEFKGHVEQPDGTLAGGGTAVEAYVGDTLCGTATVRRDDAESWFTLLVAGPAVPGCARGGTITFEADGAEVPETEVNDLAGGSAGRELRLTIP